MRVTLPLLVIVLDYLEGTTPLALMAAHPQCRLAAEARGVAASAPAVVSDADGGEEFSAAELLQPLLRTAVYERLPCTWAGVRIGCTHTFLVPCEAPPWTVPPSALSGSPTTAAALLVGAPQGERMDARGAPLPADRYFTGAVRVVVLCGQRLLRGAARTHTAASSSSSDASATDSDAVSSAEGSEAPGEDGRSAGSDDGWEREAAAADAAEGSAYQRDDGTEPLGREGLTALPAGALPPSWWWLIRGLAATPQQASRPLQPAGPRVGLYVHMLHGYPRWVRQLLAVVPPSVLHGVSVDYCQLTQAELAGVHRRWARRHSTTSVDGQGRPLPLPLPLRAFRDSAQGAQRLSAMIDVLAPTTGAPSPVTGPPLPVQRLEAVDLVCCGGGEWTVPTNATAARRLHGLRRLAVTHNDMDVTALTRFLRTGWATAALGAAVPTGAPSVPLLQQLEELDLQGCSQMSALTYVMELPALRTLQLARTAVTDESLEELERYAAQRPASRAPGSRLVYLSLSGCAVDRAVGVLARCLPHLRQLDLSQTRITATPGLAGLRGAACLRRIVLDGCDQLQTLCPLWCLPALTAVSAKGCRRLRDATTVACAHTAVTEADRCTTLGLEELCLERCPALSSASAGLVAVQVGRWSLRRLVLDYTEIDDDALLVLCGLQAAPHERGSAAVRVRTAEQLLPRLAVGQKNDAMCKTLAELSVCNCRQLRSLAPLAVLPSLRVLHARHCGVVDTGLSGLEYTGSLQHVDLSHTQLTTIAPLARIATLKVLLLSGVRTLTDEAVLQFVMPEAVPRSLAGDACAAAASLEELDLSGCSLRAVGCLGRLPALRRLSLSCTTAFDVTLYGLFASEEALLRWRARAHEPAPRLQRAPEEESSRSDVVDGSIARVPDLAELHQRLAVCPSVLIGSAAASLRAVDLQQCGGVRSIEPLGLLPQLRWLDASYTAVDSTALRGFVDFHLLTVSSGCQAERSNDLPGLQLISLRGCKYVADIGCLAAVPSLRTIDAAYSLVEDDGLTQFAGGHVSHHVTDSSPHSESGDGTDPARRFQQPSQLRKLLLDGCSRLRDVRCLLDLAPLRELGLAQTIPAADRDFVYALRQRKCRVGL